METLDLASLLAEPAPLCWDRLHAMNGPHGPGAADGGPDQAPPPAADALDQALPWLVRHLGVADALSAVLDADAATAAEPIEAAEAGEPTEVPMAAAAADPTVADGPAAGCAGRLRGALRLIGYEARLRPLALADLQACHLPALLLLLRRGDACVLTQATVRGGERLLHVVMPGQPPIGFTLPPDVLAPEYTGVALLLRRLAQPVLPPPAARQGPLARLALALQAALAPPTEPPAARWRSRVAGWIGRPVAAFKFGQGRPITG